MNRWDAEAIGHTMSTSWPRSHVLPDAWADGIEDLERAPAEETMRRLQRTAEHAPTIRAFRDLYHSLLGTAGRDDACPRCADSGWVTCTDHPHHRGHWQGREDRRPVLDGAPDECACNVVRPCACKAGKGAQNAFYGQRRGAA